VSAAEGFAALAVDALTVSLGRRGHAVTGQQRVPDVVREGATLRGRVTFGPYAERVEAGEVLVWVAGAGPAVVPLVGLLGIPAGVHFDFDLEYVVSGG
jgi:hypothetical protein